MSASSPFSGKLRYFAIAAFCVAADLLSKWWVFDKVEFPAGARPGALPQIEVVPDLFYLVKLTNPGAVGGLGQDHPWPLVGLRSIAVVVVAFIILRVRRARWFLLTALALVLGGAIGNLYDNLALRSATRPGEVRDFLSFDLSSIGIENVFGLVVDGRFNAFNIADACIVCGAIALVLTSFAKPAPQGAAQGSASRATS